MRAPGALAALAAVAALALSGQGCRRRGPEAPPPPPKPKPVLGVVSVQDLSPGPEGGSGLDVPALERGLRERLLATGLFAQGGPDAGPSLVTRVRAVVGAETVEVGPKGEARAHVRVAATTRPSDAPGALEFDVEGQGAAPYTVALPTRAGRPAAGPDGSVGGPPALGPLVLRVAGDLVDGYAARRRLRDGAPSAVHAALLADGGELREEAIRTVGERELRDEAPALLKLLDDPDEPTRDAALGALIALGDRRAVSALTRSRSLRDRHEMRKIIEAIAILGGQEADDYLSFVAATHDDEEIRAAASRARSRIARRETDAGAR
jgi:hypothetical protein